MKKLRRIPAGGGRRKDPEWHFTNTSYRLRGGLRGQDFIHVVIDDHSRFAYVEALGNEKAVTTVEFLLRAVSAYERVGVKIERVLTDNGSNYISRAFKEQAAELGIGLRRTRSYWSQTNGEAEAFIDAGELVRILPKRSLYRRRGFRPGVVLLGYRDGPDSGP